MEITVYNPQKGRLETIAVEFTKDNTTWFESYRSSRDIDRITDLEGGLLITKFGYTHPVWIYDTSTTDTGYSQKRAKQLPRMQV